MTTDLEQLPEDLPIPIDDGAADHLVGLDLPAVVLSDAAGGRRPLTSFTTRWLVIYVYPRTGGPSVSLSDDWDLIPGARGCTPQSCAFRDHHAEMQDLGATVMGLSGQPIEEQTEFAERMHIPFPLLNDRTFELAGPPLRLPTFTANGLILYKRLTLIADAAGIRHVIYPVFPPDQNAADVIEWLSLHDRSEDDAGNG